MVLPLSRFPLRYLWTNSTRSRSSQLGDPRVPIQRRRGEACHWLGVDLGVGLDALCNMAVSRVRVRMCWLRTTPDRRFTVVITARNGLSGYCARQVVKCLMSS